MIYSSENQQYGCLQVYRRALQKKTVGCPPIHHPCSVRRYIQCTKKDSSFTNKGAGNIVNCTLFIVHLALLVPTKLGALAIRPSKAMSFIASESAVVTAKSLSPRVGFCSSLQVLEKTQIII